METMIIRIARDAALTRDWLAPAPRGHRGAPLEYDREHIAHAAADAIMSATRQPAYVYRLHADGARQRYYPVDTAAPESRIEATP